MNGKTVIYYIIFCIQIIQDLEVFEGKIVQVIIDEIIYDSFVFVIPLINKTV